MCIVLETWDIPEVFDVDSIEKAGGALDLSTAVGIHNNTVYRSQNT